MALDLPIQSPLTEAQAELTSKIGSMQSLLALPFNKTINIPKGKQISTFDYLLKILRAMGLPPEFLFQRFFDLVFDEAGSFLEEKVLRAIAAAIARKGRDLTAATATPVSPLNEAKIKELTDTNEQVLLNAIPNTFLTTIKKKILEDLTRMIFGPFNKIGDTYSPTQQQKMQRDVICGVNAFSVSNKPVVRNEDIEFNKIQLREQLESGTIQFEISCQQVKISLPEDPEVILNGTGANGSIPSTQITPAQSVSFLVEYVESQTQNINNQNNANAAGKSFWQILLDKFLNYISTLVIPHLGAVFSFINTLPAGAGLDEDNTLYSLCELENDPDNKEKQEFAKSLINALLKELLKIILLFLIKQFKIFVKNYFARTAKEKARRAINKIKARFKIINQAGEAAEKAAKYAAAAASLATILGVLKDA